MRIWDVSAGYLTRQNLLGEHRELHAVHTIVTEARKGYSRHPETLRWVGALDGLASRHAQLAAEMRLRGFADRTPLPLACAGASWPARFVTHPADQLLLLRRKYAGTREGRIRLPDNAQQLWAHHKYSVMARDPALCRQLGRLVSGMRGRTSMRGLAETLVLCLREPPPAGRLRTALEHLWGHVRDDATREDLLAVARGPATLLWSIQALAVRGRERFLLASTALSELAVYVEAPWSAPRREALV